MILNEYRSSQCQASMSLWTHNPYCKASLLFRPCSGQLSGCTQVISYLKMFSSLTCFLSPLHKRPGRLLTLFSPLILCASSNNLCLSPEPQLQLPLFQAHVGRACVCAESVHLSPRTNIGYLAPEGYKMGCLETGWLVKET